jgi:hypothetical protein
MHINKGSPKYNQLTDPSHILDRKNPFLNTPPFNQETIQEVNNHLRLVQFSYNTHISIGSDKNQRAIFLGNSMYDMALTIEIFIHPGGPLIGEWLGQKLKIDFEMWGRVKEKDVHSVIKICLWIGRSDVFLMEGTQMMRSLFAEAVYKRCRGEQEFLQSYEGF